MATKTKLSDLPVTPACPLTPVWLKQQRAARGMSQAEMAAALRVAYVTYQKWELGENPIPGIAEVALRAIAPQ